MNDAIERIDTLFLQAFETNHPAMHDWAMLKFELRKAQQKIKELEAELAEMVHKDNYLAEKRAREKLEAELADVRADLKRMEAWGDSEVRKRNECLLEIERLGIENERLKEVLGWYGDEDNYSGPTGDEMIEDGCYFHIPIEEDKGQRARDVSKGKE